MPAIAAAGGVRGPRGVGAGLAGALLTYLVLFGPLVLFEQVATSTGGVLAAGLMLTALPAGFGLAAVAAERILPAVWSDRRHSVSGAAVAVLAAAGLALPVPMVARIVLLAVLGVGVGVYIPANNAATMASVPHRLAATVGVMVNMARGLGTAVGVAAITVALHVAKHSGGGSRAQVAAGMGVLVCAALAAAWTGRSASAAPHPPRPVT